MANADHASSASGLIVLFKLTYTPWWKHFFVVCVVFALSLVSTSLRAQRPNATGFPAEFSARVLERINAEPIYFGWRLLSEAEASPPSDTTKLTPDRAVHTAWLLHQHLAQAQLAEAAALSNAPRRRHEELLRFQASVGEEGFKKLFSTWLQPGNAPIAEAAIGDYRLLIWTLHTEERITGEFYVAVDGRMLIDDGLSATRTQLRQILEAVRAGWIPKAAMTTITPTPAEERPTPAEERPTLAEERPTPAEERPTTPALTAPTAPAESSSPSDQDEATTPEPSEPTTLTPSTQTD